MSTIDPLRRESGPWLDFLESTGGQALPGQQQRNSGPQIPPLRMPTEDDILDAVFWRIGSWSPEAIDAASAGFSRLLDAGIPLDTTQPDVVSILEALPKERRSSWSGLMALAVLHADAHGDERLFFLAGMDLMTAYRQAKRAKPRPPDELSKLIAAHLTEEPGVNPDVLFNTFADRSGLFDAALVDFNPDEGLLVVQPRRDDEAWLDVTRVAFRRRVQRIRHQYGIRQQPADVETSS